MMNFKAKSTGAGHKNDSIWMTNLWNKTKPLGRKCCPLVDEVRNAFLFTIFTKSNNPSSERPCVFTI
eukprot:XP_001708140.1 Hypothetical protein GL50803_35353 [Giardia lamblia ATCC 50803]